ncbi:putative RNA polymerase II nuclear localization protein SLC7A6OS [Leptodactylus fuscus]|uniref:putative RNA polymerase II nuclear localization protein SLC7A6OS n=1 Tax=Leptodactylus fuscus TaxID=238119 RepID=UPI003F4E8BA7
MDAAVLRVKRKRGADPVEALIVCCKRARAEATQEAGNVTNQVFKLAATVSSQNEPVQKYVQEAIFRNQVSHVHHPDIGSLQRIQKDLRAWKNTERQESRYRLVSSLRPKCVEDDSRESENNQHDNPVKEQQHVPEKLEASAQDKMASSGSKDETFQVLDIVQEETKAETVDVKASDPETIMCNSVKMIRERLAVSQEGQGLEHRENPDEFVYDIYYAESSPHNWVQDILSVQPYYYEQELMDDNGEADEVYEDEDDENEENNWRNDYPDEEEECSDREYRYMGYYEDSDEDTGHEWHRLRARECEYDENRDSD